MGLETMWFPPPGLSPEVTGFLIFCSAMTSMLTATAGIGGGVLLFAIMAWVMPLTALIPVHGVVQIGSNIGRMLLMLRSVQLTIFLPFFGGSVIGGALGAMVVVDLPPTAMQIGLGAFILWAAWMKPPTFAVSRRAIGLTGLIVTFLTMFFGATAPLIASVLRLLGLDRLSLVATQAACVIAQHSVKVVAFGFLGFALAPYLSLVMAMTAAGFCGTWIGNHLLQKIADQRFHVMLSCVLSILALGLLTKGASALVFGSDIVEASLVRSVTEPDRPDEQRLPMQTEVAGNVDREAGMHGSLVRRDRAAGSDDLTPWEAANRRLEKELDVTQSELSSTRQRALDLAQHKRQDRQRIAALEQDFEEIDRLLGELETRMGGAMSPTDCRHSQARHRQRSSPSGCATVKPMKF